MDPNTRREGNFLPDFCESGNLLRTMVVAELLAFVLTAARGGDMLDRLQTLGLASLFVQWVAICDIALLCALRRWLMRIDERAAAFAAFVLLQLVTLAFTVLSHDVLNWLHTVPATRPLWVMLAEHMTISAIVGAVVLRYFYVTAEWRRNVQAEAQARVQALQARIRPHFLFNSMNTIASLTRADPEQAEAAVEDLAELFRASLADRSMLDIAEELELVASYLRIERARLGERLQIEWAIRTEPGCAQLPALTLQPLVENAVYHGIERAPGGGTVRITSEPTDDGIEVRVRNPLPPTAGRSGGHRIAQDNVRQRLALAFGDAATMRIDSGADYYEVRLQIPPAPASGVAKGHPGNTESTAQ